MLIALSIDLIAACRSSPKFDESGDIVTQITAT